MNKDTRPHMAETNQSPVEKNILTDDGELQDDELDEVSGGNVNNPKLITQMITDMSKMKADISMAIARNLK